MSTVIDSSSSFWDAKTKLLHLGLAAGVTIALGTSLVMEGASGPESIAFEIHEWVGLGTLVIVLLHWIWSAVGVNGLGLRHLFPLGAAGRKELSNELLGLGSLQVPPGGPSGRLSGLVHGLGLLAATAMVATGAVIFFAMPENSTTLPPVAEQAKDLHEFFSVFVWVYWAAHVAMALVHEFIKRDGALRNMFRF